MKCRGHIKLGNFNNVFWELNMDEVTLVGPLLKGFCLNMIFSGDIDQNVREYISRSTFGRSSVVAPEKTQRVNLFLD